MDSSNKKNSEAAKLIARRSFLIGTGAAAAGLACWYIQKSGQVRAEGLPASPAKMVTIVEFSDSGERKGKVSVEHITKTEDESRAKLVPSGPTPTKIRTITQKACFAASAAIRLCLIRAPNSNPVQVGRVFGRPLRKRTSWKSRTPVWERFERRFLAGYAMRILGMSSMTARRPRASVIA
jgi:hypothetical protein